MKGSKQNRNGGSREARRRAVAILEVLGGEYTTAQAAAALGVTLPRYYLIEQQALEGLIRGCEPKPKGRQLTPEREAENLRKEVEHLKRECSRQQALVRAAQRSIGLSMAPAKNVKGTKGRKPRKPTARALRVARQLSRDTPAATPVNAEAKKAGPVASLASPSGKGK